MNFVGKCAIITGKKIKNKYKHITPAGAGSGIGAGVAEHFSKLGCSLILNDINAKPLEIVRQKCVAHLMKSNLLTNDNNNNSTCQPGLSLIVPAARNVYLVVGDVNELDVLKKVVELAVNKFGRIDILVFYIYFIIIILFI
jgi:NAD(P)-dependent dehydrogenase (short-subunit alcohol dehydrogenase family)